MGYAHPVDPNFLPTGLSRETEIRRDAQGRWFNGPDPIDHPNVVAAFNGWIERADDGRLCLRNDLGWAYFSLEGPAYYVEAVHEQEGELLLQLSGARTELLRPSSLSMDEEGRLGCLVLGGSLYAEFRSHAAVQLGEWIEVRGEQAVFSFGDITLPLGQIA